MVWAGRPRRDEWQRLCDDYRRRLSHWTRVEEVVVKVRGGGQGARRRAAEAEALRDALPERCWTVALDRRGKARDSEGLARWYRKLNETWPHPLAFLIGSDLGLAPELRAESRETVSFGPMTLPHQLARLVLYEQLYRALSIGAGIKYHRGPL